MKITRADKDHKVKKLIKKLTEVFDKDDQKEIDALVRDLICTFSINHAVDIAHRTWKQLKKERDRLKETR